MQDGQIPSRLLMSLDMICGIHINYLYGHLVTKNIWSTIKYSIPHIGSIMVPGRWVVYTAITLRITCDTLLNILYSILITGQSNVNITPNMHTYVNTYNYLSMTHEIWSSFYPYLNNVILSHLTIKLDYRYFKNNVLVFNGITWISHT